MNNIFYVYGHYRLSDGILFYIGKGNRDRAYTKDYRNKHWWHIIKKHDYRIDILHDGLTEDVAFEYEIGLIKFYGRKDNGTGILVNMTDGGEGLSGAIHSPEHIAKHRKALIGKTHSPETKAKMSAAKKGKPQPPRTPEHCANMSKAQRGKSPSLQTRGKLSAANMGKPWTEARRLAQLAKQRQAA